MFGRHTLAVQIASDSTLQFGGSLTQNLSKVLQIITCSNTKFADEILCSTFQIAVVLSSILLLGSSKICIG